MGKVKSKVTAGGPAEEVVKVKKPKVTKHKFEEKFRTQRGNKMAPKFSVPKKLRNRIKK